MFRFVPKTLVALFAIAGLLLMDVHSAGAAGRKLDAARKRYEQLQKDLDRLTDEHSKQETRLSVLRGRIRNTETSITKTEAKADQLRSQIEQRAVQAYTQGSGGFVGSLFDADNFREFAVRVIFNQQQASADETLLLEARRTGAELRRKQRSLEADEASKEKEVGALRDQSSRVGGVLRAQQALVANLTEAERQSLFKSAGRFKLPGSGVLSGAGRVIAMQACPASGPRSFSNDWGAPRGGGRRRHKGTDVFSAMGSPAGAVVSGRISRLSSGGNGGMMLYLKGNDGNEYFYAHMSSFKSSVGQSVSAGQTIATVGNSGNARGGAPHIHFEIHPGGGAAINPFPSVARVC